MKYKETVLPIFEWMFELLHEDVLQLCYITIVCFLLVFNEVTIVTVLCTSCVSFLFVIMWSSVSLVVESKYNQ